MDHDEDCAIGKHGFEGFLKITMEHIEKYGWSVINTETELDDGTGVGLSYTVGLEKKGLPEIAVFGLPAHVGQALVNEAARLLVKGKLPVDEKVEKIGNLPLVMKEADPVLAGEHTFMAERVAGYQMPVLQMVWPDRGGIFPWEDGFDMSMDAYQPKLYDGVAKKPKMVH